MTLDPLQLFSQPTIQWFKAAFGEPTEVQQEAWPAIAAGKHTLVSAPTGTGKTLSAFLYFIDYLKQESRKGTLRPELYVIYISPLKSLAGDIRENLRRPMDGISGEGETMEIEVALRTGDTPQRDRQRMLKYPPHILITTPETLYLMLTGKAGQSVLKTTRAIILDELHAVMDTKRGAHLMLSLARLDKLCEQNLQRIGLSATIEPLSLAAEYLSPDPVTIAAPKMEKKVRIEIIGSNEVGKRRKDPVWEDLSQTVYQQCLGSRSVIAFCEGRRFAEKLAYYVNQIGGDGFARVHHGSLSKEQRLEVEEDLRDGRLRLLCATSSMELGIDVGEIDIVLQIGCPRTISGTMQRLGRAGHNPNRVSVMYMYPRTAPEGVFCGMTAQVARQGGVEKAQPPKMCLDVLAQHLVSMAAGESYSVEGAMEVLKRAYSFREVTTQDVKDVLCMLAGDYEHKQEIAARPRIIYDRIHEQVRGDNYSRMLAVASGGTIPDKGLYTVKTEDGVKIGELDEEFIYETRLGDRFLLGSFAWKIVGQDKNTVFVTQAPVDSARLPFWKGEIKGRSIETSRSFGRIMRKLGEACENGTIIHELQELGLDETASLSGAEFLHRQIEATGGLPDDRTILVEHFQDYSGTSQIMVHSLFGRRVNAPLSILLQHAAEQITGLSIGCVDEEDGFLLYPYGDESMPEGLLFEIDPRQVRDILEAVLPVTPVFSFTFRYNAARALMMGMKQNGRQPLWIQRLRSTQMLDSIMTYKEHPLIRETRRECLEEIWDIQGVLDIIHGIRSGMLLVREIYVETPSPLSLPLQWQVEAAEMYAYSPTTPGMQKTVHEELEALEKMKPAPEELDKIAKRRKLPEDEDQLHSLLMMEGDLLAGELEVPVEWLELLIRQNQALYLEPGLWIAAEHQEEYEQMLQMEESPSGEERHSMEVSPSMEERHSTEVSPSKEGLEAGTHIIRRLLYYRGAQTQEQIKERYFLKDSYIQEILIQLCDQKSIVEDNGVFYHSKLYDRARRATIRSLREQAVTQPAQRYAALMADRVKINAPSEEQLKQTVERYCGKGFPISHWESLIFPIRVKNYRESMLDKLLAQGEFFWQLLPDGNLCFHKYDNIDWEADVIIENSIKLDKDEMILYRELKRRGASFLKSLANVLETGMVQETLLKLAEKGLVCADSFVPVRQLKNQEKLKKATARHRVNVRVMLLSAGRWDIVRPVRRQGAEELLEQLFRENILLCRETFRSAMSSYAGSFPDELNWGKALEVLRIWEYTGRARRGYFIAGMSGAQFIRNQDYQAVTNAFDEKSAGDATRILWVNATDPAQVWGKALEHLEKRSFMNVPGTEVALVNGLPAAILERQGNVLRVFDEESLEPVLAEFVKAFKAGMAFPGRNRLIVKEYPASAQEALKQAGFMKEMQDYVLYK